MSGQGRGAFRWYFAGSVVSDFGTWLQNTAQVVLAYQLEHSVLLVGLVTCAQFTGRRHRLWVLPPVEASGNQWTGLILAVRALIPILVLLLLPRVSAFPAAEPNAMAASKVSVGRP